MSQQSKKPIVNTRSGSRYFIAILLLTGLVWASYAAAEAIVGAWGR